MKNNEQLSPDDPITQNLQGVVLAALKRHPLFFSAALPRRVLPPMFNRYAGTHNTYGDHIDQAVRYAGNGDPVRADVSCTLFLCEPDSYEGGDLVVESASGLQRWKLPAGHLALYPASTVHRVEAVTRGQRLAGVFWVQSLVRCPEKRQLLFDMDLNLMRLRQRLGDSRETVALTGTYHNLLRQWAQT